MKISEVSAELLGHGQRTLRRWPAVAGAALILGASLLAPRGLSVFCFWAAALLLLGGLAFRVGRDPGLTGIVVAGYVLQSALATLLHEASARSWPLLRGLQLDQGFWYFAPDASYYHDWALVASVALRIGLDPPYFAGANDFPFVIMLLYRWLGAHPLYPVFVNGALLGAAAVLAYLLAREIGGVRAGRIAAGMICFWPSLTLWSTQILKESLVVFFLLAVVFGFERFQRSQGVRRAAWGVEGAVAVFAIYRLRPYVAVTLLVAAVLVCAIKAVRETLRAGRWNGVPQVALVGLLVLAAALAAVMRPSRGDARDIAAVYRAVAAHLQSIGDTDDTERVLRALQVLEVTESSGKTPQLEWRNLVVVESPLGVWRQWFRLDTINLSRAGFLSGDPASHIDADMRFTGIWSVLRYLPRAVFNATLTPNPLTRFSAPTRTGAFRQFSMAEVFLICAFIYCVVRGFWQARGVAPELTALLSLHAIILATLLGLLVPTVGILFRVRLAFLIPLCVLAGIFLGAKPARRESLR